MFDFYAELAHQQTDGTAAQLRRTLQGHNEAPPNAVEDERVPDRATDPSQGHGGRPEKSAEQKFAQQLDRILNPGEYR